MEDVYSEASTLADDLDAVGLGEFADGIRETMAAGAVATAILMA